MLSDNYSRILCRIYSEPVARQTALRIAELVSDAKSRVRVEPYRLSAADVVLITYGDTLRQSGIQPLQALRKFYVEYLRECVNSIHLLPFHPYTSDDGFSVVDFYSIDEALGDWSDIEALGAKAHLMFDAVVNHVSKSSRWFRGFLAGEAEYENWFIEVEPDVDLSLVTRPRSSPVLSKFVGHDGRVRHVWTTFSDDQIDLNVQNPDVLLALLRVLLFYVEEGAKFIRLDAIAFLWKEPGTSCIHLPQTHEIVRLIRHVVEDVNPAIRVITETNVPHSENMAYLGDGYDEAHMIYNFALPPLVVYSLLAGSAVRLSDWARDLVLPSDQTCFFNFTASHDGVGIRPVENVLSEGERRILLNAAVAHGGSISNRREADGTESPYELNCSLVDLLTSPSDSDELRINRLLVSQAIALVMPGIPAIYIHSLLGSRNDLEAVDRTGRKRSINRARLDVETLIGELADEESLRSRALTGICGLLRVRRSESAFDPYGAFSFPEYDERVFSVLRGNPEFERQVLCLINVSATEVSVRPDIVAMPAPDLLSGALVQPGEVDLPGYGMLWLDLSGVYSPSQ